MDLQNLKKEIKEIGEISSSVPEPFREKCFEILLNRLLEGNPRPNNTPIPPPAVAILPPAMTPATPPAESTLTLPSSVKAFIRKKSISQEQLESVVMVEGDEFHFIREPTHDQAAKGQTEWALLVALKNGIQNNSFKADPEEVRSLVQEKGYYDKANFAANFRKSKCAGLFRGPLERQGDAQALTSEGETALAELLSGLASS